MDETAELLIAMLARTDALFSPLRLTSRSMKLGAAVEERRAAYRRAGLPIVAGGSDSQRKSHSRQLAAARAAGYVQVRGRTRLTARLTSGGDAYLRTLVGSHLLDEAWPLLEAIAAFTFFGCTNSGCVPETAILHAEYSKLTPDRINRLELLAAPLLAAGLLCTASDLEGRLGYWVTPDGRRALAAGTPPPPESLPTFCSEAGDLFDEMFSQALIERDAWQPETSLVVVPLSCGLWPASLEAKK